MALIGWLATVVVGVAILTGIFIVVTALPDINRYRRLRKM
jgi:hypothetical protein